MPKKKLSKKYKGGANTKDIHLNEIKKLLEERKLSGSNQEINDAILSYRVLLYRFTSTYSQEKKEILELINVGYKVNEKIKYLHDIINKLKEEKDLLIQKTDIPPEEKIVSIKIINNEVDRFISQERIKEKELESIFDEIEKFFIENKTVNLTFEKEKIKIPKQESSLSLQIHKGGGNKRKKIKRTKKNKKRGTMRKK